jgi:hypothetical protein
MRHPLFWQFLITLVIVAFIVKFIWWLVAARPAAPPAGTGSPSHPTRPSPPEKPPQ